MNAILRYGITTLAIVGLMSSTPGLASAAREPAQTPAQLIVEDNAQMFSPAKIQEAKRIVAESMGEGNRQAHIETFSGLSASEQKEFDAAGANKTKFWSDWAKSKAGKGDRGPLVLILKEPAHLVVLVDKLNRDHGFDDAKENALREVILKHFREGKDKTGDERKPYFDAGLIAAAEYLKAELPHSVNDASSKTQPQKANTNPAGGGGSNIMSYICIGVAALLGIWLIFGLIRAFSGGGGGGGPGGGGGGGFGTSLLGGLFGAMAGMWMYNNLFGGHTSSAFGGDNLADGGGDSGGGESAGAGDYSGDSGSGGDYGGGDTGGGGGDWGGGGGGDWGGGGGDF